MQADRFEPLLQEARLTQDPLRDKAWSLLVERGFPTKKWEDFRHTPLPDLYRMAWKLPSPSTEGGGCLPPPYPAVVFVNGHFSPSLSTIPSALVALPLREAYLSYGPLLRKSFAESPSHDPFFLLNHALYQNGLFLYMAPRCSTAEPLSFLFVQTEPLTILSPKVELFIGKESSISLIFNHLQKKPFNNWHNGTLQITLEEGAECFCFENSSDLQQGFAFHSTRAMVKGGGLFHHFSLASAPSCVVRHQLCAQLVGEGARAESRGLALLSHQGHTLFSTEIKHIAPHTRSCQGHKSVLAGRAHSHIFGTIYVDAKAQKTEAYQTSQQLLLSAQAKATGQPNLKIFADDVKASHGFTCTQPNEEELFYLRARGLGELEAKKEWVSGFCREQVEMLPPFAQIVAKERVCSCLLNDQAI